MDLNQPRQRVNASMIPGLQGNGVCILGKAHHADPSGMSFRLTASDDQDVVVRMTEPLQEDIQGLVEVQGSVNERNEVVCQSYILFPGENTENFDMTLYNKAIQLMKQVPTSS
ncbi:hypothetical protein NP493_1249g00033 [Ridgeia piscesae]|uniref:Replication factor A protein 3 n=1 Tax=Ridgeia piscesae TaxID=27915 RepID=A0AAD9KC64_RIDPI|nr:hypothetical protein NP493_1249g00033 [Ridgeia piscesae]